MNKTSWTLGALLLSSLFAACTPDPCSASSPCPNDTPPTQAQRTQCRATFQANSSSPCYSEAVNLVSCVNDSIVCGGDGRSDSNLTTTRARNNCMNQIANLNSCCARSPGASACQ